MAGTRNVCLLPAALLPHLNIAETLWRKLKYEWLQPSDYTDKDTLHYAVWKALAAVGDALRINFAAFNHDKHGARNF